MRDSDDIKDAALRSARRVVKDQLRLHLQCACLLDKRLRPRRETLEDAARPHVERLERLLRRIDQAIEA
jgi:hypothetical protein